MPRVTFDHYLEQRHFLTQLWKHCRIAFATLSPVQQDALHTYFRPSDVIGDQLLRAHLDELRRTRPSAANQGGKAYVRLLRIYTYAYTHCDEDPEELIRILLALAPRAGSRQKTSRRAIVAGARRSEVDIDRLVMGFLLLMKESR